MDETQQKLENLEKRLTAIENRLGLGASRQEAQPGVAVPPAPPPYVTEMFGGPGQAGPMPSPAQPGMMSGSMPPPPPVPRARGGVESYIGRKVLAAIGILAVVVGVSYFLRYAFVNNIIGINGRIILGVTSGLIFIVLGEYLRKKYPRYSDFLTGGGLALLYLSIYGSFWFYKKIDQTTAFGFMSAVTAFGVILSLWADTVQLGTLAIIGGFVTPSLLSTGVPPSELTLFGYFGILSLAILAISFFKKWHLLTTVGFIGFILNFAAWYGAYYKPDKLALTIYILTIFFIIYFLSSVVSSIVAKKLSNSGDLFLLTVNPAWFFGWLYYLLKFVHPEYKSSLGFIAAGFAALYVITAYISSLVNKEDKRFTLFLGAVAVLFLTIAIPLELNQNAITIAWAVEAAVLFILGSLLENLGMRIFGMAVLAFALVRLFGLDSGSGDLAQFTVIFNKRFFTYFATIVASAIMGYFAIKKPAGTATETKAMQGVLWTVVNFLILVAITVEISTLFDARIYRLEQEKIREIARKTPLTQEMYPGELKYRNESQARSQVHSSGQYNSYSNQRNAAISVFWTIYAIILITLGIVYRSALLRWSALALFGITIIKVFFVDLAVLETLYRVLSFIVLGIILLLASYLYYRFQKRLEAITQ